MLKKLTYFALASVFAVPAAFAQQQTEPGVVERDIEDIDTGVFDSPLTVTPQVGVLGFQDAVGDYDSRALYGFSATWNAAPLLGDLQGVQAGLETGFLFSRIGNPGSNLIGTSEGQNVGAGGANSFLVPLALVGGWDVGAIHVTGRAGASFLYRSVTESMTVGRVDEGGDARFDPFPMLGIGAGWDLASNLALSLRGDYIPTPADDMFTATLGATIGLG